MVTPLLALLVLFATYPIQEVPGWRELADSGSWGELLDAAEGRLEQAPGDAAALAWAGRASHQRGLELLGGDGIAEDLGRALVERGVEALGSAVRLRSDGAPVVPDEAWRWWMEARADLPEAVEQDLERDLEGAWVDDPVHAADAAQLRGLLALERGQAVALTWLRRAWAVAPSRSDLGLALAEAEAAIGNRDLALQAWDGAERAADHQVPRLVETLLTILPRREDAVDRLPRLDRLVTRAGAGNAALLEWHRAYALDQLGRPDDAERAFSSVSAEAGRPPSFDRAHAVLLLRLERHAEAVSRLRPLLQARDWDAYSQMLDVADDLALARRWDEALSVYEEARRVESRDERLVRNRALTCWRAGRFKDALEAWRGVLDLFPGRADILNDAALAFGAAGEQSAALELFVQATGLPGAEDARENRAALLLRLEPPQVDEARRLLDGILLADPHRDRALVLRYGVARSR